MTRQEKITEPHIKMVYIAHPYNGWQKNVDDVQNIILKLLKKYPDTTYYSPLHATGFFYFELSYEDGMEHCFEALRRCDEIWFCENWQTSRGCNLEMAFAREHGIPFFYVSNDGEVHK